MILDQSGATDKEYYPQYDGAGNLIGLIDDTGSIAATYEYDPFGNIIRVSGSYAGENPFRFSTKYTDTETGLVYFGHRYYSPGMGRFINRDPLGEAGGRNLYGFVGNNPLNRWDYLGLKPTPNDLYRSTSTPFIIRTYYDPFIWGKRTLSISDLDIEYDDLEETDDSIYEDWLEENAHDWLDNWMDNNDGSFKDAWNVYLEELSNPPEPEQVSDPDPILDPDPAPITDDPGNLGDTAGSAVPSNDPVGNPTQEPTGNSVINIQSGDGNTSDLGNTTGPDLTPAPTTTPDPTPGPDPIVIDLPEYVIIASQSTGKQFAFPIDDPNYRRYNNMIQSQRARWSRADALSNIQSYYREDDVRNLSLIAAGIAAPIVIGEGLLLSNSVSYQVRVLIARIVLDTITAIWGGPAPVSEEYDPNQYEPQRHSAPATPGRN